MTWGDKTQYNTTYLQNATDSPADARPQLLNAVNELTNVIDGLGVAGGAAKLDSTTTKVIANFGVQSTGDINLTPTADYKVSINTWMNLNPVAYANLPTSPANGDIAFLTTDGASATQNKPIYYETTNNRWNYMDGSAVATS
jgi:hypothetical protein